MDVPSCELFQTLSRCHIRFTLAGQAEGEKMTVSVYELIPHELDVRPILKKLASSRFRQLWALSKADWLPDKALF